MFGDDTDDDPIGAARDIELRQLRHVLAVAEQGNLAAAAAQMQLSQSSLSRSVAAIQRKLGAPLFLRRSEGLLLTEVGRLFIERAQALVRAADELDRHIGRNASLQVGRLVVGISASVSETAVARVAAGFFTEMPGVTLELRSAMRNDLLQPLRQGELDLLIGEGLAFAADHDLEVTELPALPLVVVVRQGHPLTSKPRFDPIEAFGHPVVVPGRIQPALLDGLLQAHTRSPDPAIRSRPMPAVTVRSLSMLERLLHDGDVVSACPPAVARPHVEAGRLVPLAAPDWLRVGYALVRLRSRSLGPALDLFIRRLRATHEDEVVEAQRLIASWLPGTDP